MITNQIRFSIAQQLLRATNLILWFPFATILESSFSVNHVIVKMTLASPIDSAS